MKRICDHLGLSSDVCDKLHKWLKGKYHCKWCYEASPNTAIIRDHLGDLRTEKQRLLYSLLVVCACNKKTAYDAWFSIAQSAPIYDYDMKILFEEMYAVLQDEGWLAAPMLYPVSSATAKQLGLPKAPTMPRT